MQTDYNKDESSYNWANVPPPTDADAPPEPVLYYPPYDVDDCEAWGDLWGPDGPSEDPDDPDDPDAWLYAPITSDEPLPWDDEPFVTDVPPPTDADAPPEPTQDEPEYTAHRRGELWSLATPAPELTEGGNPTYTDAFTQNNPTYTDASTQNNPTYTDASTLHTLSETDLFAQYTAAYRNALEADLAQTAPDPCENTLTDTEIAAEQMARSMPPECIIVHPKTGECKVDTWAFATWFWKCADLRYINYQFYLYGKKIPVIELKCLLVSIIRCRAEITPQGISNVVQLLEPFATCTVPTPDANTICFENKTLTLQNKGGADAPAQGITLRMSARQPFSLCRIPHPFDPTVGEPTRLLAFLNGLFAPDDLQTVQEYLGYCLLPSTKAQKALFIIGKGGEGKSRLSVLMKLVLGEGAVVASVGQIGDRFFNAMLEDRLLLIDDDLQTAKFNATDAFKSLVTNETAILVEAKGKPHYEIRPCVRFLLMGNQSVGSLHDKTHGFYRRVHIVPTLPAPKDRVNNPTLIQDIWAAEQAEILLWLVKGALRLARQSYRLTESEASKQALVKLKEDDNTALSFLQEQTFAYGAGLCVTSSQLTAKYKEWCYDNDLFKVGGQAFKQTCEAYFAKKGGQYSTAITTALGRVRGYTGVALGYA